MALSVSEPSLLWLAHCRLCLVWGKLRGQGFWALGSFLTPNSSRILQAEDTTIAAQGGANCCPKWRSSCPPHRGVGGALPGEKGDN
jgi:hypothetical protein